MPDSVVNVSAASSIIFPVRTVYFARAGALEVSGRMLPGESRNSTSPGRVGCGLPRAPPARIVHEARERAGRERVFLEAERSSAQGFGQKAGAIRFWPALELNTAVYEANTQGHKADKTRPPTEADPGS